MARILTEPSRTFAEYLLIPGYTSVDTIPENVSLRTPVTKFKKSEKPEISMNIPLASAVMQAVSDDNMAVALAKEGGISFIFGSQSIESQAAMVKRVKDYKAGFVKSDSNLRPDQTLKDILDKKAETGHSTVAVTEDGTSEGKLVGIVTSKDYRVSRMDLDTPISEFMTPFDKLVYGKSGITLSEANDLIWDNKVNQLPVIDENRRLTAFVFRKDYNSHKEFPNELLDDNKSYIVGAGINSRDFKERVPALIDAGVDVLTIDSSEGYSEWQAITLKWIRDNYGDRVKVGAANVVDKEGSDFLVKSGADFVKVGIGGGSICITREQKGIGRGQASSIIDVAKARNEYFEKTGIYVPICSDGGIVYDYHMTLALAMGADFIMLGRYFARFDESPSARVMVNGSYMKEYWGEGSTRARNWQRYDLGGEGGKMKFEEGVDSYVPYAGPLHDNVLLSLNKIKSTMCNCGVLTIKQLQDEGKLTLGSSTSIVKGGAHDVVLKDNSQPQVRR